MFECEMEKKSYIQLDNVHLSVSFCDFLIKYKFIEIVIFKMNLFL